MITLKYHLIEKPCKNKVIRSNKRLLIQKDIVHSLLRKTLQEKTRNSQVMKHKINITLYKLMKKIMVACV